MAYHYTASELWHSAHDLASHPNACNGSDQNRAHGESDWATLGRWSALQNLGVEWITVPSAPDPGPAELGVVADLYARRVGEPICTAPMSGCPSLLPTTSPIVGEPAVRLIADIPGPSLSQEQMALLTPDVYTVRTSASGQPIVTHQGTTDQARSPDGALGMIRLLGITDDTKVYASVDVPGVANGRLVSVAQGPPDGATLDLQPSPWQPSVDLEPQADVVEVRALTVRLTRTLSNDAPTARLMDPTTGLAGPIAEATMIHGPDAGTWQVELEPTDRAPLPHYGIVWIESTLGQHFQWYLYGGVGPISMPGFAPLRDGWIAVDRAGAGQSEDMAVLYTPARYAEAIEALPATGGLVARAFDIDIVAQAPHAVVLDNHGLPLPSGLFTSIVITQFVDPELLAATSGNYLLAHFGRQPAGTVTWGLTPASPASDDAAVLLNWFGQTVDEDGIYAVVWQP